VYAKVPKTVHNKVKPLLIKNLSVKDVSHEKAVSQRDQ
jgi:hypothetical protein